MTERKHPYEYITPDNFEYIRQTLRAGLEAGSTPRKIAEGVASAGQIPIDVAMAIVQVELLEPLDKKLKEEDEDSRTKTDDRG